MVLLPASWAARSWGRPGWASPRLGTCCLVSEAVGKRAGPCGGGRRSCESLTIMAGSMPAQPRRAPGLETTQTYTSIRSDVCGVEGAPRQRVQTCEVHPLGVSSCSQAGRWASGVYCKRGHTQKAEPLIFNLGGNFLHGQRKNWPSTRRGAQPRLKFGFPPPFYHFLPFDHTIQVCKLRSTPPSTTWQGSQCRRRVPHSTLPQWSPQPPPSRCRAALAQS